MSVKTGKFFSRILLGIYAYFLIYFIGPIFGILGLFPFFLEIPFLNILLGVGVILLEGYIFLWMIPWFLYKGSGFKKKYYPILPITSLFFFSFIINSYYPSPSAKILQKEASTLVGPYTKASKTYFSEYGELATSTKDIGQYFTIAGCQKTSNWLYGLKQSFFSGPACNEAQMTDYSNSEFTRWYSPSGNYEIKMKSENDQNIFIATPTGKFKKKGFGVSGCFNSKNGKTNILERKNKFSMERANCAD